MLYQQEEFQVLHNFLSSLRLQTEAEIWSYQQGEKKAEQVRNDLSVAIVRRNLLAMLENLPAAVQSVEDYMEKQKEAMEKMKKAGE